MYIKEAFEEAAKHDFYNDMDARSFLYGIASASVPIQIVIETTKLVEKEVK